MGAVEARHRSLVEIHVAVFLFGFPGLFGKWLGSSNLSNISRTT